MSKQSVCIIGGGAAGLVTAYLLRGRCEVTLFESSAILGGHIRTLNGNVATGNLDIDLVLDAGVIEFDENHFSGLAGLLDELGVARREIPGTTALYPTGARPLRSPGNIAAALSGPIAKAAPWSSLIPVALSQRRFMRQTKDIEPGTLYEKSIGDFLGTGLHAKWLRMLLMYAYSMAYENTTAIPAAMAVPMLRLFTGVNRWTSIEGGTYSYVGRMIELMDARLHTDAEVVLVSRGADTVEVRLANGESRRFDKLVFATPPDRVLALLEAPTEQESLWFCDWQPNHARTVIHYDTSLYERRKASYFSEFDLFETPDGAGYNAYLNRLSGIPPEHPHHYFLAFNLDHEIDPDRIVHEQLYSTPFYHVSAMRHREAVIAANGDNNTIFAGAWLGDGLHEGAVRSAERAATLLGGHRVGD